jgi:hypothetical protein
MPVERQVFVGVKYKYRPFCFLNIEIWETFLRLLRFLLHSYKFLYFTHKTYTHHYEQERVEYVNLRWTTIQFNASTKPAGQNFSQEWWSAFQPMY